MAEPPIIQRPDEPSPEGSAPARLPSAKAVRTGPAPGRAGQQKVLENRWFVLGIIFFAMMFLGLPLLWRCPSFSRLEKVGWTLAVLVYSVVVIWVFVLVMLWSYQRITDSLGYP